MKTLLFFAAIYLGFSHFSQAGPDLPLEARFKRSEKVMLAHVVSVKEHTVIFRRTELLRGDIAAEITLSLSEGMEWVLSKGTSDKDFLLFSQGDARYGPPLAVLDATMDGQGVFRGWMVFPIRTEGDTVYVVGTHSIVDGKYVTDGKTDDGYNKLSLVRVKRLLETFSYDPHVNDKR
jgi:hypothetical protein